MEQSGPGTPPRLRRLRLQDSLSLAGTSVGRLRKTSISNCLSGRLRNGGRTTCCAGLRGSSSTVTLPLPTLITPSISERARFWEMVGLLPSYGLQVNKTFLASVIPATRVH
eukprot:595863-Amphidinium_carterae.1